ncbi:TonB-dependent receptor [Candidatus Marinimicrobia bacterium]|nr:TonB-dependent receptor [Candidatus Neomarinimicrobiota bacterium]MDB2351073.1 TonB-dependent receptor [Candidatus Neomarinimicrobiota bacterium]
MQKLYSKILLAKIITITALQLNIASAQQDGSVYGFVTDSSNGEALIGANVFINELGLGMATDINGYYVLQGITPGIHEILVSYVGYEILSESIEIVDGDALKLDLVLREEVVSIGEVEVTAEKLKRKNNIQPSTVNLSPRMLRSAPALAEPDLFRTIQALPGVLTTSEFSTGLVIRGGNTDQNLILLDGVTVYNPSHLGGIFSNFIVDGVKEAELIKGAYNAEYGGRLSAVLNIISREGNKKKVEGKANLSLLSAQATLEGPFYKGAWVFSGRRTYFDKIFQNVPSIPPYYFYDIQSHIYSDLTPKDRISLSFYNGVDDLIFDTFGLAGRWGNRTISTQYRRVFSEKLIGNFLLANSLFFTEFGLGGSNGLNSDNEIDDATLAANFSWFKSSTSVIKFGAQIKNLGFLYTNSFNDSLQFKIKTKPKEYAGYAKLKYSPSEKFILEPGVRINLYNVYSDSIFPDLRFGMKYLLTEDRYINFSVGNYHQFIATFQDDYNPTILDQWIAVDNTVDPAKSSQIVLGYEEYINDLYKLQVEGYYKDIKNLFTFEESRSTTDEAISDTALSDIVTPSNGYAYGLELFAQKMSGRLSGWLAYTYSVSRKSMNSIFYDKNEEYYNSWDRTHSFSALGNYQISKKWDMNWKMSLQSGQAYTPIIGYYNQILPESPDEVYRTIPGTRNSARYSPYSRLDLGFVYHTKFFGSKMDVYVQIINLFNRKNTFRKSYNVGSIYNGIDDDRDWDEEKHDTNGNGQPDVGEYNVDEEDEGRLQVNDISLFPIIPTIGFSWEF